MRHYLRRRYVPLLFLAPLVLLLVLVNLYPAVYQIITSFTSRTLGFQTADFVGVANYVHLFQDGRFWNSLWITLQLLIFTVPIELAAGMVLALLLNESPHRRFFLPVLLLPMVVTPIVVGFIFKYMYQQDYGIISYLLKLIHLYPGYNPTSNIHTVLPAIAVIDIWEWTPFAMIILLAGLQSLSQSVLEAANLDGASRWQIFWWVIVPLLKGEIIVVLLFRFVDVLRIYDIIYALTRGGPGSFSESVSIYLQLVAFRFREIGYASAFGIVLVFLGAGLASMCLRILKSRESRES